MDFSIDEIMQQGLGTGLPNSNQQPTNQPMNPQNRPTTSQPTQQTSVPIQDLFNPTTQEIANNTPTRSAIPMFKPNPKTAPGGVYQARIRFIGNPHNTSKNIVSKESAWISNPETGQTKKIDLGSTNEEIQEHPLKKAYWAFFRSGKNQNNGSSPSLDSLVADKLKSKKYQYALVQILDDPQNKGNVGRIMVWELPFTVYDTIVQEINLPSEQPGVNRNPFHPITGRDMFVRVSFGGQTGNIARNNYSGCMFNTPTPVRLFDPNRNYMDTGMNASTDPAMMQKYAEYVFHPDVPLLSEFDPKPMTSEELNFINEVISLYTQKGAAMIALAEQRKKGIAQNSVNAQTIGSQFGGISTANQYGGYTQPIHMNPPTHGIPMGGFQPQQPEAYNPSPVGYSGFDPNQMATYQAVGQQPKQGIEIPTENTQNQTPYQQGGITISSKFASSGNNNPLSGIPGLDGCATPQDHSTTQQTQNSGIASVDLNDIMNGF